MVSLIYACTAEMEVVVSAGCLHEFHIHICMHSMQHMRAHVPKAHSCMAFIVLEKKKYAPVLALSVSLVLQSSYILHVNLIN